ncbi:MAG TPA: transglycosylase SLT domain-containing protein [Acidimicrobiia bacterium]|nr:transglycosylase SLT domain-containing protein [Acidimicrobiia bacterium]
MSFHRFVYVCGWTAVALLAIVGFAAFSTDPAPTPDSSIAVDASWGVAAGAVSGQGWLALAGTGETATMVSQAPPSTSAPVDTADTGDSPNVTVATGWLDSVEVRALVERYFASAEVNRAVRLAWCVSRFDIDAISPSTGASGLFQIDPNSWSDLIQDAGISGKSDIFDPEASTAVAAYIVYHGPGWTYWDCQT